MYAGHRAAILFNAQIMPADSWEADLSVETVPTTTISILRNANIIGPIDPVRPNWTAHGIPSNKISGGIREVSGKMHGFWRTNLSIPSEGDTVSLALTINNVNWFVLNQCIITKLSLKAEVKGSVEWDIEWESIGDGDFTGRF